MDLDPRNTKAYRIGVVALLLGGSSILLAAVVLLFVVPELKPLSLESEKVKTGASLVS